LKKADKPVRMVHYTQYGIIEGIRRRDKDVLKYVYKQYFPMVRYFIIRNQGSEEDAEDIFQEAVVAIFERVRKKSLTWTVLLKHIFIPWSAICGCNILTGIRSILNSAKWMNS
jgi:hypothetical protein